MQEHENNILKFMDTMKVMLREIYSYKIYYIKNQENSQINNTILQFKKLEKNNNKLLPKLVEERKK